jgi:hypothetical protein
MAMNYCEYYMNTLSIYISTRAMSSLDLVYYPDQREFYIWYPAVEDRSVVLYLKSDSRKVYPPIECLVQDAGPDNLFFFFDSIITKNGKIPIGYKMEVNL